MVVEWADGSVVLKATAKCHISSCCGKDGGGDGNDGCDDGDDGDSGCGMVVTVMMVLEILIKANSDLEKPSHSAGGRAGLLGRTQQSFWELTTRPRGLHLVPQPMDCCLWLLTGSLIHPAVLHPGRGACGRGCLPTATCHAGGDTGWRRGITHHLPPVQGEVWSTARGGGLWLSLTHLLPLSLAERE